MNEDNSINFLDNDGCWHIVPISGVIRISYDSGGKTRAWLVDGDYFQVDPDCAERLARGLRDVELSAAEKAKRKQGGAND